MARIVRTAAAIADLAEIWSFIAADNVVAADRLLAQIDDALNLISSNPEIGFEVEDLQTDIRCKPVRRTYLIFYRIVEDDATILRVLHGRRNIGELLS